MKAEILSLLREAPATTGEVAALIGKSSNKGVGATLRELRRVAQVKSRRVARVGQGRGPRVTTMWEVT